MNKTSDVTYKTSCVTCDISKTFETLGMWHLKWEPVHNISNHKFSNIIYLSVTRHSTDQVLYQKGSNLKGEGLFSFSVDFFVIPNQIQITYQFYGYKYFGCVPTSHAVFWGFQMITNVTGCSFGPVYMIFLSLKGSWRFSSTNRIASFASKLYQTNIFIHHIIGFLEK